MEFNLWRLSLASGVWSVLILDVVGSRRLAVEPVRGVADALRPAIREAVRWQPQGFRLAPELLKGDEIQSVLHSKTPPVRTLMHLRAAVAARSGGRVRLWAGIGRGTISRLSTKGPFESDGPAFHRARQALDSLKLSGGARLTACASGSPEIDRSLRAILGLLDTLAARWTPLQWHGVLKRLEGKTLQAIASRSDVSLQMVSKRLRAVSWHEVEEAITIADQILLSAPVASGTNQP